MDVADAVDIGDYRNIIKLLQFFTVSYPGRVFFNHCRYSDVCCGLAHASIHAKQFSNVSWLWLFLDSRSRYGAHTIL